MTSHFEIDALLLIMFDADKYGLHTGLYGISLRMALPPPIKALILCLCQNFLEPKKTYNISVQQFRSPAGQADSDYMTSTLGLLFL